MSVVFCWTFERKIVFLKKINVFFFKNFNRPNKKTIFFKKTISIYSVKNHHKRVKIINFIEIFSLPMKKLTLMNKFGWKKKQKKKVDETSNWRKLNDQKTNKRPKSRSWNQWKFKFARTVLPRNEEINSRMNWREIGGFKVIVFDTFCNDTLH